MFLPQQIKDTIPDDIVNLIESYLPKKKKKGAINQTIQRELEKLGKMKIKGMKGMYMREFSAFVVD